MLCPRCQNELLALEFEHVEVDWCPACEGLWLDAGELGLLLHGRPGLDDARWTGTGRPGGLRCPLCRDQLCSSTAPGTTVEIDACPHRHGLWLDRGELEQLGTAEGTEAARLAAFCARLFPDGRASKPGGNL